MIDLSKAMIPFLAIVFALGAIASDPSPSKECVIEDGVRIHLVAPAGWSVVECYSHRRPQHPHIYVMRDDELWTNDVSPTAFHSVALLAGPMESELSVEELLAKGREGYPSFSVSGSGSLVTAGGQLFRYQTFVDPNEPREVFATGYLESGSVVVGLTSHCVRLGFPECEARPDDCREAIAALLELAKKLTVMDLEMRE